MKIIIIITILIMTEICADGQNLVGYKADEIIKYMKENRTEMSFNKVINKKFYYLKYSDSYESQTTLFFLTSDSVCISMKIICDVGIKAQKVKELNSIFKKSSESRWIDKRDGKDYLIELMDEKWSCVITIEPDI